MLLSERRGNRDFQLLTTTSLVTPHAFALHFREVTANPMTPFELTRHILFDYMVQVSLLYCTSCHKCGGRCNKFSSGTPVPRIVTVLYSTVWLYSSSLHTYPDIEAEHRHSATRQTLSYVDGTHRGQDFHPSSRTLKITSLNTCNMSPSIEIHLLYFSF